MQATDWIKGFRLIFENAQRLYKAAEVLEEKKEYPIANSLLILAAEEAMKAYTVATQHFFPEKTIDNFGAFFKDHKEKLDTIRSIIGMKNLLQKMEELHAAPIIDSAGQPEEERQRIKDQAEDDLLKWLEEEAAPGKTKFSEENNWWRHATGMREDGLYVKLNGNNWATPVSIKKATYLKSKKYVTGFMDIIQNIYDLDMEDPANQMLIAMLKDGMQKTKNKEGKKEK